MGAVLIQETLRIGYVTLILNLMGLAILRARADARQSRAAARRRHSTSSLKQ